MHAVVRLAATTALAVGGAATSWYALTQPDAEVETTSRFSAQPSVDLATTAGASDQTRIFSGGVGDASSHVAARMPHPRAAHDHSQTGDRVDFEPVVQSTVGATAEFSAAADATATDETHHPEIPTARPAHLSAQLHHDAGGSSGASIAAGGLTNAALRSQ